MRTLWLALAVVACARNGGPRQDSKRSVAASAVATAPLAPSAGPSPSAATPSPATPSPALVRVDGATVLRLVRERGGRGTLVNIWATWCGPCRRELPMFRSLADNVRDRALSVLLVSVDEAESEPAVLQTLQQEGFAPPFYIAERPLSAFKRALHPTWPGMIPVTFLFDADARRRYFWGGPVFENELLPIVEGFLSGKNIDGEARFELAPGQTTP